MFNKSSYMKRKIRTIITFLLFSIVTVAQSTDYTKVIFHSKIYEYKKIEPRTNELGVDKALLSDIINLLGDSFYTKKQKKDIISKAWLAFNNPKTFDFVYKDFAVKTIKNWGQINAKGELVLEPNPYLTEWTINDDEFPYFQLALKKILDHYNLIAYGDDAEGVKSSFTELLITKSLTLKTPNDDDWAYSYLEKVNIELKKKGLVALVTKGHYDILVCEIEKQEKLTALFSKLEWELIKP